MAEHGNDLVILMEFHGRTCVELMNPSRLRKLSRIDNPFLAATVYIYILSGWCSVLFFYFCLPENSHEYKYINRVMEDGPTQLSTNCKA